MKDRGQLMKKEIEIKRIQPIFPPLQYIQNYQDLPQILLRQTKAYNIKNLPFEYSSALRRALLSESSSLTIDKIKFFDCNCSVPEDYIALRLGLVPLHYNGDISRINNYYYCEECRTVQNKSLEQNLRDCKYCKACTFVCRLKKKNDTNQIITVTDRDIQFLDDKLQTYSNYYQTEPIPIVRLGPTQSIFLVAEIKKGQGKIHSKWMTVSDCMLNPKVNVKINIQQNDIQQIQNLHEWLQKTCPRNVFSFDGNQIKINSDLCILCNDCVNNEYQLDENNIIANVCSTDVDYNDVNLQFESIFDDTNCISNAINETLQTLQKIQENDTYAKEMNVQSKEQENYSNDNDDDDWN